MPTRWWPEELPPAVEWRLGFGVPNILPSGRYGERFLRASTGAAPGAIFRLGGIGMAKKSLGMAEKLGHGRYA